MATLFVMGAGWGTALAVMFNRYGHTVFCGPLLRRSWQIFDGMENIAAFCPACLCLPLSI